MKKLLVVLFGLLLLLNLTGCSYQEDVVEVDTTTEAVFDVNEQGEATGSSLAHQVDVLNEDFKLEVTYDLGTYTFDKWMITDNKSVRFTVKTVGLPEGAEVFIEHVHADISMKSTLQRANGITQDSMDDSFHGVSQDGFYINDETTYDEVFAIEGYNDTFFSLWGHVWYGYGSISGTDTRFSEKKLVVDGEVYAQKLSVVFDILVKSADENYYHTTAVVDEVLIPVKYNGLTETRKIK